MSADSAAATGARKRTVRVLGRAGAALAIAGLTAFFGLLILIQSQTGEPRTLYAAVITLMFTHHVLLLPFMLRWAVTGLRGAYWSALVRLLPVS